MRTVELTSTESFTIKGREGEVYLTVEPDPVWLVGEHVLINGRRMVVRGIERHPIAGGPKPGMRCGVLAVPMGQMDAR